MLKIEREGQDDDELFEPDSAKFDLYKNSSLEQRRWMMNPMSEQRRWVVNRSEEGQFASFVELLARVVASSSASSSSSSSSSSSHRHGGGDVGDGGNVFMEHLARLGKSGPCAPLLRAAEKINGRLATMVESQFGTMAWKPLFRESVRAFPRMKVEPITRAMRERMMAPRSSDSDDDEEGSGEPPTCEACGRKGHRATHLITLKDEPYDSFSFHNSERWDKGLSTRSRDVQRQKLFGGEEREKDRKERAMGLGDFAFTVRPEVTLDEDEDDEEEARAWTVGSTCRSMAWLYHAGWHFKYRLLKRVQRRLENVFHEDLNEFLKDCYLEKAGVDGCGSQWIRLEYKRFTEFLKIVQSMDAKEMRKATARKLGAEYLLWSSDEESAEEESESEKAEEGFKEQTQSRGF